MAQQDNNLVDAALQPPAAPPAAAPSAPTQTTQAPNLIDSALGSPSSVGSAPASSNLVDRALNPETGAPQKYQTQDPNMPWYERAWDWANSPLINLNPENQGGFTGGAEDVASSL